MYVFGLGWYAWDGLRWVRDGVRKVMEMAKSVARAVYAEAEALDSGPLKYQSTPPVASANMATLIDEK
jgi:hypothetical protein